MEGAENAIRTTLSGGWAVPPTRVNEVMEWMGLPAPKQWTNLPELIYKLNQAEGGPSVNNLIQSLPSAKLLPRRWANIPEDLQNLWLLIITLTLIFVFIVKLWIAHFRAIRK